MSDPGVAWQFVAIVRGEEQASQSALYNLRRICSVYLKEPYEIEVVDLAVTPERAEEEDIIALPTVIRRRPLPETRILGDLSDTSSVLRALNVQADRSIGDEWSANIAEQVKMLHYSIIRLSESFLSMVGEDGTPTEQQQTIFRNILRSARRHLAFERNLHSIRNSPVDAKAEHETDLFEKRLDESEEDLQAGRISEVETVRIVRDWFVDRFRS